MQNVNLIVALHSSILCNYICSNSSNIVEYGCQDKDGICALLLNISNVVQNEYTYINNIRIDQYRCHEKRICALFLIICNVVHNVNVIVTLNSALSGSFMLA